MKVTQIALSLIVTASVGFAASDASIDAQIQAIQEASPQERVGLMNAFKTQLSTMNAEDRLAAIEQMRTQMQAQMQSHGESGEMSGGMESMRENAHEMGEMARERAGEHAQEMQIEHGEEMNRMQNMNQQQAGSQFGHENEMSGGSMTMGAGSSNEGMFDWRQ